MISINPKPNKKTEKNHLKKKILITSALPYVNNIPHLGNIIGCVLSADVFSRYCKSCNLESMYICGSDEYGTATEIKALEEGLTPREICDKYSKIHKQIYDWFGIKFDYFGRTSTKLHEEITHQIFNALYKNGFVVEEEVEQPYDEKAKMFLADRYIEGVCPFCQSEQARADQCDKCGKLLTFQELINPLSKITKSKPILKRTKHLFIDLPSIEQKLVKWIETTSKEGFWSANSYAVAKAWLKEGLKKRAITRDLKWGVPVPLKGYENKVIYVWFEAPIGYISITANHIKDWKNWWQNPSETDLYQFMGKDNITFHTVIFPSTLLGTKDKWTMLHHIGTTEFLNYEGGKFSKSKGIGVFGNDAIESGVPADVWRYYLLINRPEQADTNFSWSDFGEKLNNELVANLGNLVNRTLVFIQNNTKGEIPKGNISKEDEKFLDQQKLQYSKISKLLDRVQIKDALHEIMLTSKNSNRYFQENKPWELIKSNPERAAATLYILANQIKDLAILVEPYLPFTSSSIFKQLNTDPKKWENLGELELSNHKIGKVEILFKKIEPVELEKLREKYSGKQFSASEPSFSVSDQASGLGIKAAAAIIEINNISNKNAHLENLKNQKFEINDQSYIDLHKKVHAEEQTSIRWLQDIVSKTGKIPNINTLVDSYNLISLKHGISAGAHDISKIKGNVRIDICDGAQYFTELGSVQPKKIKNGEYAAVDDEKVICRLELRQCDQTKVTKDSKKVLLYYQGTLGHSQSQIDAALKEACELIRKVCTANYKVIYPDPREPEQDPFQFKNLDIEVGEIISAEKHPNADKLLVEKVRLGDKEVQVVSGIAQFYKPEQIIGKRVIILRNLKPAILRGIKSEGMILVAEQNDKSNLELISPSSPVGSKVQLKNEEQEAKNEITADEYFKLKIEVKDGKIYSEGKQLITETGEELKTNIKEGKVY